MRPIYQDGECASTTHETKNTILKYEEQFEALCDQPHFPRTHTENNSNGRISYEGQGVQARVYQLNEDIFPRVPVPYFVSPSPPPPPKSKWNLIRFAFTKPLLIFRTPHYATGIRGGTVIYNISQPLDVERFFAASKTLLPEVRNG